MSIEIALSKDRDRPRERTASNVSNDNHNGTRLELVVDVTHGRTDHDWNFDFDRADRHALDNVRDSPAGSLLRVVVGRRIYLTDDALKMLRWLKGNGVHVLVMAETIEAGLTWTSAIDGREVAA